MTSAPSRSLHRLVYASRAAQSVLDDLEHVLRQILIVSINRNRDASVTGILIVHEGWFVQALEGPKAAVEATYARIVRDPWHNEATLLATEDPPARAFDRWSMCAAALSEVDDAILERLGRKDTFDPLQSPERWVMQLLVAVSATHELTLDRQHAVIQTFSLPAASGGDSGPGAPSS